MPTNDNLKDSRFGEKQLREKNQFLVRSMGDGPDRGRASCKLNSRKEESQKELGFSLELESPRRKCSWSSFRSEVKDLR